MAMKDDRRRRHPPFWTTITIIIVLLGLYMLGLLDPLLDTLEGFMRTGAM